MKFASDLPYPPITTAKNPKDAKLLMGVYCGACGELSSILTYAYQSYVSPLTSQIHPILKGIAKVEMLHHSLLGESIYALGGYPVMGARTYWNGSFVDYAQKPETFLKNDIADEQNAILNYERTMLNLDDDSVKALIERIILDEQVHIKILSDLQKELQDSVKYSTST